jgi:predicted ATP-dependent endonuclease of OLD family
MRIKKISTKNFRSLEDFEVNFDGAYTAICGKNNSGKTNLIRAIRAVIPERDMFEREVDGLVFNKNYPAWKKREGGVVSVTALVEVFKDEDAGLFEFIRKFSALNDIEMVTSINLEITVSSSQSAQEQKQIVKVNGATVEDVSAAEILRKVQTSGAIIFHNATDAESAIYRYSGTFGGGTLGEFASSDRTSFDDVQNKIDALIQKLAKKQQADVAALIGKLEDKYQVGLGVQRTNLKWMPMQISLGTKKTSLPLDEWGSGTRNRTEIILMLLKAKKVSESQSVADRIKPVVVVEEPESFLHPSAQAEFGRVLREIAEELAVQVIVTTHSPYLLSMDKPSNNILLKRDVKGKEQRETKHVPTEGEKWMEPFALALGIDNKEFEPWKTLIRGGSKKALMVEGETDKAFIELLKSSVHGASRLLFDGEIIAYGGYSALQNTAVLKLVLSQSERCVITYDLDCAKEVESKLAALGLAKGKDYFPIGKDNPGYRDIEGLVPDVIRKEVFQANTALVSALSSNVQDERKKAKEDLKKKLFNAFKASQLDRATVYSEFYKLSATLNRCYGLKP